MILKTKETFYDIKRNKYRYKGFYFYETDKERIELLLENYAENVSQKEVVEMLNKFTFDIQSQKPSLFSKIKNIII